MEKTAKGAIKQIKDMCNPAVIREYGGEILLVGINYNKNAPAGKRKHTCIIEKLHVCNLKRCDMQKAVRNE